MEAAGMDEQRPVLSRSWSLDSSIFVIDVSTLHVRTFDVSGTERRMEVQRCLPRLPLTYRVKSFMPLG